MYILKYRSSRPDVFCLRGALKNFVKFTGKCLCHSLFFNKIEACSFDKKETLAKKLLHTLCETSVVLKSINDFLCLKIRQSFWFYYTLHPRSLSSFYYFKIRSAQIIVFKIGFLKFKLLFFNKLKKRKTGAHTKKAKQN